MYSKNSLLIVFTLASIAHFISCEKRLLKLNGTVSIHLDYFAPERDTSVVFKVDAPSSVLNGYPLERFDVRYTRLLGGEEKKVSVGIELDAMAFIVKIKNLKPNSLYKFSVYAIYGPDGNTEYFMPANIKDYEIKTKAELKKLNGTVTIHQDIFAPESDNSVVFRVDAPSSVLNGYPLVGFDVTYYRRVNGVSSATVKVPVGIEYDNTAYIVKIKNLVPKFTYVFNLNATYGLDGNAEYYIPANIKFYEVRERALAPKISLSKDKVLSFEANDAQVFTVTVAKFFGDELSTLMWAQITPEMGNTLALNLKDDERYSIKVTYEYIEGDSSAASELIYPM